VSINFAFWLIPFEGKVVPLSSSLILREYLYRLSKKSSLFSILPKLMSSFSFSKVNFNSTLSSASSYDSLSLPSLVLIDFSLMLSGSSNSVSDFSDPVSDSVFKVMWDCDVRVSVSKLMLKTLLLSLLFLDSFFCSYSCSESCSSA
jgi:hypothetical protein